MLTTRMNETKAAIQDNMTSQEAQNVKNDYQNLKSDVSSLASRVKSDTSAIASKAVHEIEDQAREKYAYLKTEGRKQLDRAEAQVHAKPMQSMAIAFGAGVLLALLAGRRGR